VIASVMAVRVIRDSCGALGVGPVYPPIAAEPSVAANERGGPQADIVTL
jgi:hypothetical protein